MPGRSPGSEWDVRKDSSEEVVVKKRPEEECTVWVSRERAFQKKGTRNARGSKGGMLTLNY